MAAWMWRGRNHLFNHIVFTSVVLSSILQSTSSPFSFGSTGPLYGPEDKVFILNATNINHNIFKSERVWFVEFFSSWCGHCINFAPRWKKFAEDLWDWREVVVVAGIDCADEMNTPTCRDFNIMGYPTLRLFQPRFQPLVEASEREKAKGVMETVNKGIDIQKAESMEKLKRTLIDQLMEFYPNLLQFSRYSGNSVSELWRKDEFRFGVKPTTLLVLFEGENSYVGPEVALRLSLYNSIKVYRFVKKNKIYSQLQLEGWPAAGYINADGTSGPIVLGNDNIIDVLSKSAMAVARIPVMSSSQPGLPVPGLRQDAGSTAERIMKSEVASISNRDVVSMDDLLHAMRDAFHKEIALVKLIEGRKLDALKLFVDVLNQLFPADRREVKVFLEKLEEWIGAKTEIESSEFLAKLDQLESELHPWDINMTNWDECRGTIAGRRGYTCGLWRLFHTLTITGVQKNSNVKVLSAVHAYVNEFFGCRDCKEHFTGMVTRDKILSVDSIMTQALWLWKTHNEVNLRLKGAPSEDPGFPKQRYPNKEQCSECYDGPVNFDEGKVMEYLLKIYTHPQRSSPHEIKPYENLVENSRGKRAGMGGPSAVALMSGEDVVNNNNKSQQSWLGFFSIADIGLFMIVYLSVACLLLLGYVHFKMVGRRRFNPAILFRKMCAQSIV